MVIDLFFQSDDSDVAIVLDIRKLPIVWISLRVRPDGRFSTEAINRKAEAESPVDIAVLVVLVEGLDVYAAVLLIIILILCAEHILPRPSGSGREKGESWEKSAVRESHEVNMLH